MELDLFTWGAQIVNFLILVALLRHFLYGRIVNAIDARQKKIASRWEDAEREKERAAEQAEEYGRERKELDQRRDEILSEARQEAQAQEDKWMRQAREEIDRLRANWQESLEQDKRSFMQDLRLAAGDEITKILRRVLSDLADEELERQVVRRFVREFSDSQGQAESIRSLVRDDDQKITVSSAFELAEAQREELRDAIGKLMGQETEMEFTASEDLLCGIELRGNGRKIAWSVQDYLDVFSERIGERFAPEGASGQKQSQGGRQAKNAD